MSDDGTDEIIEEFLVESAENLDQMDRDLVALERDPASRPLLGSIFRAVHTIKGTTGFLGFGRLEELAHVAENLLSKLRDGVLALDATRTTALLDAVDAIRGLLALIEATGEDKDDRDLSELIALLTALQSLDEAGAAAPAEVVEVPPEPVVAVEPAAPVEAGPVAPVIPIVPPAPAPAPPEDAPGDQAPTPAAADRSIRVDVDLLDSLMRQVGELVLARNQVVSHAATSPDASLNQTVQRLSLIVSELQEGVMKTRMQPVEHLWAKVPRLVRDLSSQFGKPINVTLEGGGTELDRSVLEAVKDPLTHLVRNAAAHGIESPEIRRATGKPATATVALHAYHEGGQVILEMTDDGCGVNPVAVGATAVGQGLVTPEDLARMSEQDVIELIFRPGFSTAKAVTNVSGRGVGMDVVRTNIEKIGGSVDLQSVPGMSTTVRIKIPLTLAIIPALLVGCGPARYAIPQAAVQELVRLEGDTVRTGIEHIDGAMLCRLRGRLLPLVSLAKTLAEDSPDLAERAAVDIVVVHTDGDSFGLVVDAVDGTQEIVVKPLGSRLKVPVYAGATILGDGTVALILDVAGIADASEVREGRHQAAATDDHGQADVKREASQSVLLLRAGADRRVAIPLAQVARLEEVEISRFERAGNRRVIQYRDDLLPLVSLTDLLGVAPAPADDRGTRPVVVCSDGQRSLGVVADGILDVVEDIIRISHVGRVKGICGTTVLEGQAADVLDVAAALAQAGARLVHTDDRSGPGEEVIAHVA